MLYQALRFPKSRPTVPALFFVENFTAAAANPQLQMFENIPGMQVTALYAASIATLSVGGFILPLSLSLNAPVIFLSNQTGTRTVSVSWGLYSLNGNSLSLANSASKSLQFAGGGASWMSLITSATQNISPGYWWHALNFQTSGNSSFSFGGNTSINPANAAPYPLIGRMTVSTNAMPDNIATTDLDITGRDAMRQPYVILTA